MYADVGDILTAEYITEYLGVATVETNTLLELAKNKFENMGYSVYFTDAKYTYQNARMTVQPNELMIAVKEI